MPCTVVDHAREAVTLAAGETVAGWQVGGLIPKRIVARLRCQRTRRVGQPVSRAEMIRQEIAYRTSGLIVRIVVYAQGFANAMSLSKQELVAIESRLDDRNRGLTYYRRFFVKDLTTVTAPTDTSNTIEMAISGIAGLSG